MRFATIKHHGEEKAAIVAPQGLVLLETVNRAAEKNWETDMFSLICEGQVPVINNWYREGGREKVASMDAVPYSEAVYGPLYRKPSKIFGIGLNYAEHARDLNEKTPQGIPGSFFKPYTTIIGIGDDVQLPLMANVCDGEGELAVILGKRCENVPREKWLDYVAGFTVSTDMTALDILEKNTRYLTIAKSFNTFFGLGHQLLTPDEIEDIMALKVRTVLNGNVFAENYVRNMTFPPDFLVSFLSEVMTWLPGDIISTGTPRGVHIAHGDVIEGQVDGFEPLFHKVVDKKVLRKQ